MTFEELKNKITDIVVYGGSESDIIQIVEDIFTAGIEEGRRQGMERAAEIAEKYTCKCEEPCMCIATGYMIEVAIRAEIKGE